MKTKLHRLISEFVDHNDYILKNLHRKDRFSCDFGDYVLTLLTRHDSSESYGCPDEFSYTLEISVQGKIEIFLHSSSSVSCTLTILHPKFKYRQFNPKILPRILKKCGIRNIEHNLELLLQMYLLELI